MIYLIHRPHKIWPTNRAPATCLLHPVDNDFDFFRSSFHVTLDIQNVDTTGGYKYTLQRNDHIPQQNGKRKNHPLEKSA